MICSARTKTAASIRNVALAGSTGALGTKVLDALLAANFTVTVLTREGSTSTLPYGTKTAEISYESPASLQSALQGQDALVSTVGFAGLLSQIPLIDAAIAADVKRILPSEYGSDQRNAVARSLPVFGHKVQVEQHLKQACESSGGRTTYTLVANNEFFDWDLDNSFGVDIKARTMEIFDGGDVPFTATPLSFVAAGIVRILQDPDKTANRVVRLHGAEMTQNRLLALLQRFTGDRAGWKIQHSNTAEREQQAYAHLQQHPEDFMTWAVMFLQCAVWGTKFGNDYSGENDNGLVGLTELSEGEIEEIVKARC